MAIIDEISRALENGDRKQVVSFCRLALDEGIPAQTILEKGLLPGMDSVAEQYRTNQIFVPHVIMVANAMSAGVEVISPYLERYSEVSEGKVVLGTVQGDIHDIGKCLCSVMLKSRGIEVIDLGVNISPEEFIETTIKEDCRIIGMSALLTSTMTEMAKVVKEAEKAGIRNKVSIFIGGAPVTQKYCEKIGADYFTADAIECSSKMYEVLTSSGKALK